jgi:hypothetical protein
MSKYDLMFPGKQIHFGDNDPKMLPKSVYLGDTHLRHAVCDDAKKCALSQAFQDADYNYDEIRVGWRMTFIVKGRHVYAYSTPKYMDENGEMKSIAKEFDDAGGKWARANNAVRQAKVPPGVYVFQPLVRRKRTTAEIENQKKRDKERVKNGGISMDNKSGSASSLRKLAIH